MIDGTGLFLKFTGILTLLALFPLAPESVRADSVSLYAFYPSEVRPRSLEEQLARHCPDIRITAFAKVKEFTRSLNRNPPDAILSLPPVIERSGGYSSVIQGSRQNATDQAYYLVSRPPPLAQSDVPSVELGVVDLLGRRAMEEFVEDTLETEVRIKRVTKLEDVLPLLTFRYVKAVFVSDQDFQILNRRSQQPLVATPVDIRLGLLTVAMRDAKHSQIIRQCFQRLDSDTNALLGVDEWRSL
jgi:hypothetical protein